MHPDDIAASPALIDRLLAGKEETVTLEKRYVHRNGHVVWAQYIPTLVRRWGLPAPLLHLPPAQHRRAPSGRASAC